jgi:predicted dehydrogenase
MSRNISGKNARIGVVGTGWWGVVNHIPLLAARPDVELVFACDTNNARLQQVKDKFGFAHVGTDLNAMLSEYPLDGLVISSPHRFHFAHASAAINHGCHVLIEKPMAVRGEDARTLLRLAGAAGRMIMIPYGWNFSALADSARKQLTSKTIGDIQHVVLHMASPLFDFLSGEELAGTENDMFRPDAATWADPARAGGYGWGQLVHALGLMFSLVDDDPSEVYAITGKSRTGGDLNDAAVFRLRNGATGVASGSAYAHPKGGFQLDIRIFGSGGCLAIDMERARVLTQPFNGDPINEVFDEGAGAYACTLPVQRFADLCTGLTVLNPAAGLTGCRAVEFLDAMYKSAASRTLVTIP